MTDTVKAPRHSPEHLPPGPNDRSGQGDASHSIASLSEFEDVFRDTSDSDWGRGGGARIWLTRSVVFIVLAVGAGAIAWAFGAFDSSTANPQELSTIVATSGPFVVKITESGQLESGANVHLRSEITGSAYVTQIVPDGTLVKKDEVVVEFDSAQFETDISAQEIKVRAARSDVVAKDTGLELAKINLDEYTKGTYIKEHKTAEADIQIAEEAVRSAISLRDHMTRMVRKGYSTPLELEKQEFAVKKAELDLEKAIATRDALRDYTYDKQVTDLQGKIEAAVAAKEAAEETLQLEEARLTELQKSLEKCTILAPQDGLAVHAVENFGAGMAQEGIGPGTQVWQSQAVVWLPDLTNMQVSVGVHESLIRQLKLEMDAKVTVQGEVYEGEIMAIANKPNFVHPFLDAGVKEYTVIVKILGQPEGLKPGLTARVEITTEEVPNAISVPFISLFEEDGEHFCFVAAEDGFKRRRVIRGSRNTQHAHIVQGLEDGEEVLLNASDMLGDTIQAKQKQALALSED